MRPQKQPNISACLPTAFAMVTNKDVNDLIYNIGHTGLNKKYITDFPYQCFHIQEIIEVLNIEYSITEIIQAFDFEGNLLPIGKHPNFKARIWNYMRNYSGVLVRQASGPAHAFAWDHENVLLIDPVTGKETLELGEPIIFWIVERRSEKVISGN